MKVKNKKFGLMTKTEKLKIPIVSFKILKELRKEKIHRVLFLPIKKKVNGYDANAMFVERGVDGDWCRLNNYDCFSFHIKDESSHLRGDFQYGGVMFFLESGSLHEFSGEFIKKFKRSVNLLK